VSAVEFSIVNVVATATLDRSVDLDSLAHFFPRFTSYNPERYFAAYFKSDKMHGKVSIFSSGKMITVGTTSVERARHELALVANYLEDAEIAKLKGIVKIRNLVATANLGFKPNLESIHRVEGVQVVYEPEQFPGAIISLTLPEKSKATILLFSSGKMVCVGLKDPKNIDVAIHHLLEIIS
jgi:TATA-box binding protein (TBP) (component of TFIID and TFIIIB)